MRLRRALAGIALLLWPARAAAYDEDVHFWIAWYALSSAEVAPADAELIASANVSIDRDADTSCWTGGPPLFVWARNADRWHSMRHGVWRNLDEHEAAIDARVGDLLGASAGDPVRFGTALHPLFDWFSHQKNLTHVNRWIGHAMHDAEGHVGLGQFVDDIGERPALASLLAVTVFTEALAFRGAGPGLAGEVLEKLRARLTLGEDDAQLVLDQLFADPRLADDVRRRARRIAATVREVSRAPQGPVRVTRMREALAAQSLPLPGRFVLFDFDSQGAELARSEHPVPDSFHAFGPRPPRQDAGDSPRAGSSIEALLDPHGACPLPSCGKTHATCATPDVCGPHEARLLDTLIAQDRLARGAPAILRWRKALDGLAPRARSEVEAAWAASRAELLARETRLASELHSLLDAMEASDGTDAAQQEARAIAIKAELEGVRRALRAWP